VHMWIVAADTEGGVNMGRLCIRGLMWTSRVVGCGQGTGVHIEGVADMQAGGRMDGGGGSLIS